MFLQAFISACGIYSFTGASISPDIETVSVGYFQNNTSMAQPTVRTLCRKA